MKGQLFEFAVLYHPKQTKEQVDSGEWPKSEVLIKPTHVLAANKDQAAVLAARAIPDTHIDRLEQLDIIVRPF